MRALMVLAACAAALCGCESLRSSLGEQETVQLEQAAWVDAYSQWTPAQPADQAGLPRINTCVAGKGMRVAGLRFDRGIGVGGTAFVLYSPRGRAASLKLLAGIDDASTMPKETAVLEIRGDGRPLLKETLAARREPVPLELHLAGISELLIRVTAPTGVFTDIIMPAMPGILGLRATLDEGKSLAEPADASQAAPPDRTTVLPTGTVLFPCEYRGYGACIGMSNAFICIVVSPQHGGRVVHVGRTLDGNMLGASGSGVAPYPEERRVTPLRAAYTGAWKWKIDDDNALRLLSPADAPHGIRWSRTFRLAPNAPVVETSVMVKNISGHDVSWSAGTEFECATGTQAMLAGKPDECGAFLVRKGDEALLVCAHEKKHGLFPYGGERVRVEGRQIILFDELTPLSPAEYSMHGQSWRLGQWRGSVKATMEAVKGDE